MTNVPNLRFPGFEGEWEAKKLGDLLDFKNGINASKEQYGRGVKFVNVSDILNNNFLTYENIVGFVDVDNVTLSKYSVEYGDLLFQRSSETREEVGTANVYLDKEKAATFGGFVIRGKRISNYDPFFLNNLLKSDAARNSITSRSGGSTRYNVGQDILSSVELCFPSIPEQEKIGHLLFIIDSRIQTQSKIIEELNVLKVTISKRIFSGRYRFDNEDVEYPDWNNLMLGDICSIIGGGTPDTRNAEYWNGSIQWFTPTEIKSNFVSRSQRTISKLGLKNSSAKLLPKGTILLTTRATIGEVSMSIVECATNQGFQSLIVNENCNNIFLFYWIKVNKHEFEKRANGSTFPEIGKSQVEKIEINIPCVEEQRKIADFLSSIDSKIDIEIRHLQKLEEQRTFLLQQMFV